MLLEPTLDVAGDEHELPAELPVRLSRTIEELERRLSAEPAVAGVTFADRLPRMYHASRQIDVIEDVPAPRDSVLGQEVKAASVDVDYFDVLGAPILSGRSFNAADIESGHRVLIVNQSFVRVLQGRNPIGRRVRFMNLEWWDPWSPEPGPWYEIVGVAKDLGMKELGQASVPDGAGLYDPLARGQNPVYMAVRVRSDPASFGPRLREVAHAVDPTLRLYDSVGWMSCITACRPRSRMYCGSPY